MKKNIQTLIFIVLVVALGVLLWVNRSKLHKQNQVVATNSVQVVTSGQPSGSDFPIGSVNAGASVLGQKNIDFPIVLSGPSEGSVMAHYFINGKIKALQPTPQGPQIILDSTNSTFPNFIVAKDTRISKITPPYGQQNSVPITIKDLKPGNTIIISTEYDLMQKTWLTRDVLLPTDRN